MMMHTGSASVVSNVPLWSLYLLLPKVSGGGNHGDSLGPELLEVSKALRLHRSNYKNLSHSVPFLC